MPESCPRCKGKLEYSGFGEYVCKTCEHKVYDDYGKLVNYVKLNGSAPVVKLSQATGVSQEIIEALIEQGKFGKPDGNGGLDFPVCASCGRPIFGENRYCEDCKQSIFGNLRDAMKPQAKKETPKSPGTGMHFVRNKK